MIRKRYSFEGFEGVPFNSITIRELTGKDEDRAMTLAMAEKRPEAVSDKLVMLSVDEVDDQHIEQPWAGWNDLSSRVRSFIMTAFNDVNSIKELEKQAFLRQAAVKV